MLVRAAEVVVEPVAHEARERLCQDAELVAQQDQAGNDPQLDLAGCVRRDAARGDGSPRLVELVFYDAFWLALVRDGEDEDVGPQPGEEGGEVGHDVQDWDWLRGEGCAGEGGEDAKDGDGEEHSL